MCRTVGRQQKNLKSCRVYIPNSWRTTEKAIAKRGHSELRGGLSSFFVNYGGFMNKHAALQTILQCAQEFEVYLKNQNLLFLLSDKNGKTSFFESVFQSKHFKHLTGIKTDLGSNDFYRACINGKLSEKDFELLKTTDLKLQVLSQAMHIEKTAKMCGEFNNNGFDLYTQKLVGNIQVCVGMVQSEIRGYYVPNTVLQSDIRDKTVPPVMKIVCVLKKEIKDRYYNQICAVGKNINLTEIQYPQQVIDKLSDAIKTRCGLPVDSKKQDDPTSLKSETPYEVLKEVNEKRRQTIRITNEILNENPDLKRQFIAAKKEYEQKLATEKAHQTKPITPKDKKNPKH